MQKNEADWVKLIVLVSTSKDISLEFYTYALFLCNLFFYNVEEVKRKCGQCMNMKVTVLELCCIIY